MFEADSESSNEGTSGKIRVCHFKSTKRLDTRSASMGLLTPLRPVAVHKMSFTTAVRELVGYASGNASARQLCPVVFHHFFLIWVIELNRLASVLLLVVFATGRIAGKLDQGRNIFVAFVYVDSRGPELSS